MDSSRDSDNWAPHIERLGVDRGVNVGGRRLTGPQQGFGPMWQKTYTVSIPSTPPATVIAEWKANYGSFWPPSNRFYAPVAGIKPGEVGNIQGMQVLSTGVMVLYADDTSFAFMTPEGHPFAGWITFSAYTDDTGTIGQVQLIIRPSDPLWDLAFVLGAGKTEDRMWQHTLRSLARHFGGTSEPETTVVKVDSKRLWRNARNITKNAALGSLLHLPSAVVRRRGNAD